MGCDAVRWQGETTLRARARKEEQRSQRAAARLNRVCSARYKLDLALEAKKVSIHAVLRGIEERPGEICGLKRTSTATTTSRRPRSQPHGAVVSSLLRECLVVPNTMMACAVMVDLDGARPNNGHPRF